MKKVEPTAAFRKDFKRMKSNPKHRDGEKLLESVISLLIADEVIPLKNHDHPLSNNWNDHRECHIKPDLLLIYRKSKRVLHLVRLGSHSDLFKK
jgi:mRNA interferase YafQ